MSDEHNSGPGEAAEDEQAAEAIPGVEQRIAEAEAEAADYKDKLLRTLAEMENLRRRTEREVRDAGQYAIAGFARDMLVVSDDFRRALEALGPEARQSGDQSFKTLLDGVDLTERAMLGALEKHGVKRLSPQGQKFDPNFHQAMFELPDASVPSGTVVQVMQDGYVIGERMLRPALVGIAKGGPKQAAGETADADRPASGEGIDKTA